MSQYEAENIVYHLSIFLYDINSSTSRVTRNPTLLVHINSPDPLPVYESLGLHRAELPANSSSIGTLPGLKMRIALVGLEPQENMSTPVQSVTAWR